MPAPRNMVLLVNLGTPSAPTTKAVRRYLKEFLMDRHVIDLPGWLRALLVYGVILPFRPKHSAALYQKIWMQEGSPLLVYSEKLTEKLQTLLPEAEVKLAMRYNVPSLKEILKVLSNTEINSVTLLPLFPQYSVTTTGSIIDLVKEKLNKKTNVQIIKHYADHLSYIHAMVKQIQAHWERHGKPQKLLLSYHGIPQRLVDKGDPYYQQCQATTKLIVEQLSLKKTDYQMVFQSRLGRQQWLQPYCDQTLMALPKQGVKSVDVICPGFAVDCLETLEEIARTNQQLFFEHGGENYRYIPALNDQTIHAELLKQLVRDNTGSFI